ncbi:MAG TPA: hypothetical protein VKV20_01695 [Ktedonobacteraceae bacterium]|jgi:hypothetical protein|nr:hypothetical protein [Ktedonobacteraceae bacterium]
MYMPNMSDNSSSVSHEQVTEAYLKAIQLIDDRVTPFLGKATTRVLVQGAARRVASEYPFLHFLEKMPYTEVVPAIVREQLSSVTPMELAAGMDALLRECFAGLKELTGDLIVPPLHDEVARHLRKLPG